MTDGFNQILINTAQMSSIEYQLLTTNNLEAQRGLQALLDE